MLAAPAVNGDIVLVQTQDDRLIALEIDTGAQRWSYESSPAVLTLRGTGAPLLTNQLAIAGLSSGKVIALDTRRGLPVWEQRVAIPQGRSNWSGLWTSTVGCCSPVAPSTWRPTRARRGAGTGDRPRALAA